MYEWKDTSSHSRLDKERVPTEYTLKGKFLTVCIHRHIHYPEKMWLLSCHEVGISRMPLGEIESGEAMTKAVDNVERKIKAMLADLRLAP